MISSKRIMDLVLAMVLSLVLALPIAVIAVVILITDGRPVFFPSKRMKAPGQSFTLWKFRTMTPDAQDASVSGAYKKSRITPIGRRLRKLRLDELPQLFNILRGDMSFVGPRPPLPRYVRLRPDLYGEVLRNLPGVTGLATLVYYRHEEALLARCHTPEETDLVYLRRCVPAKARIDLIWARNRSLCYDLVLIYKTVERVFAQR